jgi:hypothetical protein
MDEAGCDDAIGIEEMYWDFIRLVDATSAWSC